MVEEPIVGKALMEDNFLKLQEECKNIFRDSQANSYSGKKLYGYSSLEQWLEQTKPIMFKYGFHLTFEESVSESNDDFLVLELRLTHKTGYCKTIRGRFPYDRTVDREMLNKAIDAGYSENMVKFIIRNVGGKTNIQAAGSTITYARKYMLGMLLNLASTDDDADKPGKHKEAISISPPITEEEQDILYNKCVDTDTELAKLLQFFSVNTIYDMTKDKYTMAMSMLEKKHKKNSQTKTHQ